MFVHLKKIEKKAAFTYLRDLYSNFVWEKTSELLHRFGGLFAFIMQSTETTILYHILALLC